MKNKFINLINITSNFEQFTVPNFITKVGSKSFLNKEIKNIHLPNSVEVLDNHCFRGSSVEKIILSDNLKIIGIAAFYGCVKLKKIIIPEGVEVNKIICLFTR